MSQYIQDFHSLVAHPGDWPKCMLIYQFWEGPNKELYHNYLPQGVPHDRAWYQLAMKVELDLMEYQEHIVHENWPH